MFLTFDDQSGDGYVQDHLESYADSGAFSGSHLAVIGRARNIGVAVGYLWFLAAAMTRMLCPSPSPLHESSPAKYADEAGYFAECLSLWPAIAYFTLEEPSA